MLKKQKYFLTIFAFVCYSILCCKNIVCFNLTLLEAVNFSFFVGVDDGDVHSLISNFWQTKISFVTEMEKNLELQIRIGESKNTEMWLNMLDLAFEPWTPLNITSENLKKWGQISEQEQWIHLTLVKHYRQF